MRRPIWLLRICFLSLILLTLLWNQATQQRGETQRKDSDPPLEMERLAPNLYVLYGGGGNTAFYIAKEGVLVVDAKINEQYGSEILAKIRSVTPKPIKYLVNTHYHADHTHGNPAFPKGIEILAHERTPIHLKMRDADYWKGPRESFLPNKTFRDRLTLFSGEDRVEVLYLGRGHTDGDAIVVFPTLEVAHLGDLYFNRIIPYIDAQAGGGTLEYAKVLRKILNLKGIKTFIPGHGRVSGVEGVKAFLQYHLDLQKAVRKALQEGKSKESAMLDLRLPQYETWDGYPGRFATNVGIAYEELVRP